MFKFSVLYFLSLFSPNAQTPVVAKNATTELAHNVTVKANRIEATFKDACFVVYLDGCGATALFDGGQNDFDCFVSETQAGEWSAVNSGTGDYVFLNTVTGVVTSKIAGTFGIFLPNVEGTAGM